MYQTTYICEKLDSFFSVWSNWWSQLKLSGISEAIKIRFLPIWRYAVLEAYDYACPRPLEKKKKKKDLNNHLRGNMIKEKRNVIRNDLSLWLFLNILWRLSLKTSSLGIIHFEVVQQVCFSFKVAFPCFLKSFYELN